jgi:hypothetical protein
MATFDRNYSGRSAADSRLSRHLRLDWSALVGGSLMGWGLLLLLSMIGMAVGLSVIDPFAARPAASNAGAAIWGASCAMLCSFVGGFLVVRLAGDRRRGESLAHGGVAWGMSMLLAGLIALWASGAAAFTRTPAGNTATHRNTRGQTVSLIETTGNGGLVAIIATCGALLALGTSLLGALTAASRESGVPLSDELRLRRRSMNGHHRETIITTPDVPRDETTIIPPTH